MAATLLVLAVVGLLLVIAVVTVNRNPEQGEHEMAATFERTALHGERLAPVRRTYVYIVALVSLVVVLVGASGLVDTLARIWLSDAGSGFSAFSFRRGVASNAGMLLVATPIFLLHWGLAQSRRSEVSERSSLLRKLYLYAASAVSLIWMLVLGYQLIEQIAGLAFGRPLADATVWPDQWLSLTITAAANGALVAYWGATLQGDGDYGAENTPGRTVRQLYMLFMGLAGLVLIILGTSGGIQVLLRQLLPVSTAAVIGNWWQDALAASLAQILIGAWLAFNVRAQWHDIVAGHPAEGRAAIRRLYLYAGVVIGAVATLTPAALLLREVLLIRFGASIGTTGMLLNKMIMPASFVPVGLIVWLWHWGVLRREADAYGESREGATVRRIYYYLMAATGLALLWVGSVELLHALLDAVLTSSVGASKVWHEPLANGLSLLAVGAPIWPLHWRSVQHVARQANADGAAERNALMRKIYLYGVSLVAALILLFQLAQVIYRLLLVLMGDPNAALFSTETAHQLADCLIAGIVWGVHLLAIRSDGRMDKLTPQAASAPAQSVELHRLALEERRQLLVAQLAQIDQELSLLQVEQKE